MKYLVSEWNIWWYDNTRDCSEYFANSKIRYTWYPDYGYHGVLLDSEQATVIKILFPKLELEIYEDKNEI